MVIVPYNTGSGFTSALEYSTHFNLERNRSTGFLESTRKWHFFPSPILYLCVCLCFSSPTISAPSLCAPGAAFGLLKMNGLWRRIRFTCSVFRLGIYGLHGWLVAPKRLLFSFFFLSSVCPFMSLYLSLALSTSLTAMPVCPPPPHPPLSLSIAYPSPTPLRAPRPSKCVRVYTEHEMAKTFLESFTVWAAIKEWTE